MKQEDFPFKRPLLGLEPRALDFWRPQSVAKPAHTDPERPEFDPKQRLIEVDQPRIDVE